jgi:hypothetical protein
MLRLESLFHLVQHYHLENEPDCFTKAIEMGKGDLKEVLDTEREYPPFIYYLCLEHMDNNPKYKFGKTLRMMDDTEKTEVFNETIKELEKLLS